MLAPFPSNTTLFNSQPNLLLEIDAFLTPRKRRASEDSAGLKDSSTICSPSECDADDYDNSEVKRRKRKTAAQVNVLKRKYHANQIWTKETYIELAAETGLTEPQVYKWSWDYRKQLRKHNLQVPNDFFRCSEVLTPTTLDSAVYFLQRSYRGNWKAFVAKSFATPSRFLAPN